jgi:hypothetical protein
MRRRWKRETRTAKNNVRRRGGRNRGRRITACAGRKSKN